MLTGVRTPQEVAGLGLSQRLTVRIGALLKKNTAITLAVLEGARPGSPLEALLLDPRVLEAGSRLDLSELAALCEEFKACPLALCDASGNVRVLCLAEELDAGDWAVSPEAQQALPVIASAPPAGTPLQSSSESIFAPAELDRLRLKIAAAADSDERIEALRTLMLSPLPPAGKTGILLQALSDKDNRVRAEAAGLLPVLGVDEDIAGTLASLNHSELAHRQTAAERLRRLLGQAAKEIDTGAAAVCTLAVLRGETSRALIPQLLELLRGCEPVLCRNGSRLAELVRSLTGMLAAGGNTAAHSPDADALAGAVFRLLLQLGNTAPGLLLPILRAECERSRHTAGESLLIQLMLDLTPLDSAEQDALIQLAVGYLARDKDEGRNSRAVGARLVKRGERALPALCDAFAQASPGAQRYWLLLLDGICRETPVSPAALERAAQTLLWCIESGSKGLRLEAMQCRLALHPGIAEAARARLAHAILNSISSFIFASDAEKAESLVAQMGWPAVEPVLQRLSPQTHAQERVRAVRIIAALADALVPAKGELPRIQQTITEILRRLQVLAVEKEFPGRELLFPAIGKLAAHPAASREGAQAAERCLLEHAQNSGPQTAAFALDGLAHMASSRCARPDLAASTCALLRRLLDETVLEIGSDSRQVNGEAVIEISGGEKFTVTLPVLVAGLGRIACAPNCPLMLVKETARLLAERWRQIAAGKLIWGPRTSQLLVQALRDIGRLRTLSGELRMDIVKALAVKHTHTPVMHALTEILAADDSAASGNAVVVIGRAILNRKDRNGQFPAEDRADILKALTRLAARKFIGRTAAGDAGEAPHFRQSVIQELFSGLTDFIPGCCDSLVFLRDKGHLLEAERSELDRRLREYHSLAAKP